MYAVFACDYQYPGVNNVRMIGSYEDCSEYAKRLGDCYDIVRVEDISHLQK